MQRQSEMPDAGVTVVELLVVLVIVALLAGVFAMTALQRQAPVEDGAKSILAFIDETRRTAILSGDPGWLVMAPDHLRYGDETLALPANPALLLQTAAGDRLTQPVRLLVYPDGTISGESLWLAAVDGPRQLFIWDATKAAGGS